MASAFALGLLKEITKKLIKLQDLKSSETQMGLGIQHGGHEGFISMAINLAGFNSTAESNC